MHEDQRIQQIEDLARNAIEIAGADDATVTIAGGVLYVHIEGRCLLRAQARQIALRATCQGEQPENEI